MPKSVDACVSSMIASGVKEDKAWAICQSAYNEGRLSEKPPKEESKDESKDD